MKYKIVIAALFCLASTLIPAQTAPIPRANLRFSNISSGMYPLGVSKNSMVGDMCCMLSADFTQLEPVGFLLNQPTSDPPFLVTLPPGGRSGFTSGINAKGSAVVGGYCSIDCADRVAQHGFLLSIDYFGPYLSYTQIDFPNAKATIAYGVNSSLVVVGTYCPETITCNFAGPDHGFRYENGAFSEIKFPGATSTGVFGINTAGNMVGSYAFDGAPTRLLSRRPTHSDGEGKSSMTPAIIVESGVPVFGWLYSGGVYHSINPPGSVATYPLGINSSGVIVGIFVDASSQLHGFLYKAGAYQLVEHSNAFFTTAYGINDDDKIVGIYQLNNGPTFGFQAE